MRNENLEAGLLRKKDVEKTLEKRLAEEARRERMTQPILKGKNWLFVGLIGAALVNTFVIGIVDVVAVSGFIGDVGIEKLPWLLAAQLTLDLIISTTVIQLIDKVSRVKMMRALVLILFFTYTILALLFSLNVSTKLLYPLMYLIYAQQGVLFPMALWNLANQVYTPSEAKKIFPVLSSGELLGRLIGYSLFTLTGTLGYAALSENLVQNPSVLMVGSAFLYLFGIFFYARFPEYQSSFPAQEGSTWFSNIKSSFETIQEVPFFRNVATLIAVTWVALSILQYNFYEITNAASGEELQFQTIYSIYQISVLVLPLLYQWTIGDELLERTSPKNGYLVLPITVLLGVGLAFFVPGLWGGLSSLFIVFTIYRGWYLPLYQSLYTLVPSENRGRVRSLLGNYSYLLGSLFAALFIGFMRLFLVYLDVDLGYAHNINLFAALLAACLAIYIATRIRATYEDSLLSWRVARRKRSSSALDKLDS